MKKLNITQEVKKQVEMYFDQQLDPQSQMEFLQKVNTDPVFQQEFEHEQMVRNQIRKHIYRPDNSSQLAQAIKNQIFYSKK